MDTNTKGGAPAPLTDRKLSAGMEIRRHEPPAAEAVVAHFDITTDTDAAPELTLDRAADGRWRFSVSVARRQVGSIERAAPELVKLDRRTLIREAARMDERELAPSIPVDQTDVTIRPRLARGKLRRGELSVERKVRPTTVFDPDGRSTYYDTKYPWRCLVRMTRPSGWSGSGVLIGPRHVLTASHCVDWTPGWLRVDVLYSNGSSLASAHGTWAYFTRQVTAANYSSTNMDDDYAVIVLDQRLGDRYGWLGTRTYSDSWDGEVLAWRNLGYPQDFSWTGQLATYQRDFALDETDYDSDSGRVLESRTFDNWPGQSGGPVFGFWDDGPYVVGVVSGESSSDNFVAGGSPLTGLVRRARNEHP